MHSNPKEFTKSRRLPLVIAMSVFVVAGIAWSQGSPNGPKTFVFDALDLGTGAGTYPWAINQEGLITGYYVTGSFATGDPVWHGFLRTPNGKITPIDPPGAGTASFTGTVPQAINKSGAIAGIVVDNNFNCYGFVRSPKGTYSVFSGPGASLACGGTYAQTMNDGGDVAGAFMDPSFKWHGFLRLADGNITAFDPPGVTIGPGTFVNYSNSLNNAGYLTGYYIDENIFDHGYLRAPDGTITVFDAPLSAPNEYFNQGSMTQGTVGQAINSAGVITGITIDKYGVWHGFLRSPDGTFTTFEAPGASTAPGGGTPMGWGTVPESINDRGEVSGYFTDNRNVFHVFIRDAKGKFTVYNAPGAGTDGTQNQGTYNFFINLSGKMTGYFNDSNNIARGFVRMP